MKRSIMRAGGIILLVLLIGCASVKTGQEWGMFQDLARDRTDQELLWEKSAEDQHVIRKEVEQLVSDGLSRHEAVRITLLNNRLLQSAFEEIGISSADLVQAGLLSNPNLGAVFRFLITSGTGTNIDADLFFPISDLWQLPFRKKAAVAQMEATIMRVGHMVTKTVAEAKRAYDRAHYLNGARRETEEILRRLKEIRDEVIIRRDFGFMSDLDIYRARAMVAETEVELARFEAEEAIVRSHLNRLLALGPDRLNYEIRGEGIEEFLQLLPLEDAIVYAMDHRLDVRMARFKVRQAEKELNLEKARILKHVSLGVSYERDSDDSEVFGPGFDIQLPIFDQNQAQIAKAQYRIRRAWKELQALEGQVREEVTSDLERIQVHQVHLTRLREKIIPLREKAVQYTQAWVTAMQLNELYLMETQKELLQSRREHLHALMERKHALADLELHMGGKMPRSN